jgi:hypothetical protein
MTFLSFSLGTALPPIGRVPRLLAQDDDDHPHTAAIETLLGKPRSVLALQVDSLSALESHSLVCVISRNRFLEVVVDPAHPLMTRRCTAGDGMARLDDDALSHLALDDYMLFAGNVCSGRGK